MNLPPPQNLQNSNMDNTQQLCYNLFVECLDSEDEIDFVESLIEENV
jgi:hypothetical protein